MIFHLVPHTHWDREWYLPAAALSARLLQAVDDILAQLEADPPLPTFLLDGQTVLLEDYLRLRPEQAARVARHVSDGRLQTGPWYVLADELTPSGESLIRNLLIGTAQSRRLGRRLDVAYSPDAFGHPAALPAIAAEFGLAHGVVWRGLRPGPDDGDLFRWRGASGSELLLYHLPRDGYEIGASLAGAGAHLPQRWRVVRDMLAGRARSPHVAIFVGADHHAPHPDLRALRNQIAALEPEHEIRVSRLDDYLEAAASQSYDVATVAGELRWSYGYTWTLQGVHGTRLPLKRRNARVELALERIAEPLAALAAGGGGRDRRVILDAAWRSVVRGHFHDAICGCSADAVARAVESRLDAASAFAREVARGALFELVGHDPDAVRESGGTAAPALALWNPAPRPRSGVVVADVTFFRHDVLVGPPGGREIRTGPGVQRFSLRDAAGTTIPVQLLGTRSAIERIDARRHYPDADAVDIARVAFVAPEVPGFGIAVYHATPDAAPARGGAVARGRTLANEALEVLVERNGALTLTDRATGERYPGLFTMESERDVGDAYTFARDPRSRLRRGQSPARVRTLAAGPIVAALEIRWRDLDAAFRMTVMLHAGDSLLRVALVVANAARDRRLRARLPLALPDADCIAGSAFGWERRRALEEPVPRHAAEHPVGTFPAQRFAGAAVGARGLAVLAPGHFEGEWAPDGSLAVTLLRSIGELSRDDLAERPGHAGWPTPIPGAQCAGADRSEWAIAPASAHDLRSGAVHRLWEDAFAAIQPCWIRDAERLSPSRQALQLDGDGLVLSALKPAERGDGMIVRCWNAGVAAVWGSLRVSPPPRGVQRVRADETPIESLSVRDGLVRFRAEAGELVTLLLSR